MLSFVKIERTFDPGCVIAPKKAPVFNELEAKKRAWPVRPGGGTPTRLPSIRLASPKPSRPTWTKARYSPAVWAQSFREEEVHTVFRGHHTPAGVGYTWDKDGAVGTVLRMIALSPGAPWKRPKKWDRQGIENSYAPWSYARALQRNSISDEKSQWWPMANSQSACDLFG